MNEKLRAIIAEVLELSPEEINEGTNAGNQPRWDSLRHMTLIFAVEDAFGVRFPDELVPELLSVVALEGALSSS